MANLSAEELDHLLNMLCPTKRIDNKKERDTHSYDFQIEYVVFPAEICKYVIRTRAHQFKRRSEIYGEQSTIKLKLKFNHPCILTHLSHIVMEVRLAPPSPMLCNLKVPLKMLNYYQLDGMDSTELFLEADLDSIGNICNRNVYAVIEIFFRDGGKSVRETKHFLLKGRRSRYEDVFSGPNMITHNYDSVPVMTQAGLMTETTRILSQISVPINAPINGIDNNSQETFDNLNLQNLVPVNICVNFQRNRCLNEQCPSVHIWLSFSWICFETITWTWEHFNEYEEIENAFCDPSCEQLMLDNYTLINFNNLTATKNGLFYYIRRISLESGNLCDLLSTKSTKWIWYWKFDVNEWKEFTKPLSSHIESCFIMDNKTFSNDYIEYEFVDLIKKNLMRRRPRRMTDCLDNSVQSQYPIHWPDDVPGKGYITIPPKQEDYDAIIAIFETFFNNLKKAQLRVVSIEEICNKQIYDKYMLKRKHMLLNSHTLNEMRLYHGTIPDVVDSICNNGFDMRYCGKNGVAFGNGVYFANNPNISVSYSGVYTTKYMFLADILVGVYAMGYQGMKVPPKKSNNELCDSTVNNIINPTIFVAFSNDQCYPKFLIKYIFL